MGNKLSAYIDDSEKDGKLDEDEDEASTQKAALAPRREGWRCSTDMALATNCQRKIGRSGARSGARCQGAALLRRRVLHQ